MVLVAAEGRDAILTPLREAYRDTSDKIRPFRPLFALPESQIPATILLAKLSVTALEA